MRRISRAGLVCALVGAGALMVSGPAAAVTPVGGTLPPATQVTINNGVGTQTDPHVSGDLVSYTSDVGNGTTQIRYFDFAAGTDTGISNALAGGGLANDLLSDVSGSTIAFTRVGGGKAAILAFDVATGGPAVELDPQAASKRSRGAIGGGTVAWLDFAAGAGGELVAHDRVSGATQQLTSDTEVDRRPGVSPDGNVIVWEKCASAIAPCDVYKAVKSGGGWSVGQVTSSADGESFPDTNGTVVVYGANRASSQAGDDIYWMPVSGGAESQLALDGLQGNPAIAGDLVVFESRAVGGSTSDIFAYDLSTNTLYQLANTPNSSETLTDVSVSPGGQVRVVFSVFEGQDENVYGLSFQLAPTTTLKAQVQAPVNTDGTSTFNANRGVVPLKFTLTDNASPTCNLPPATLRLTRTGGAAPGAIDENVYSGPSDSGTDFRIADCQYHYNIQASALGAGSYLAEILIAGSVAGDARFELK